MFKRHEMKKKKLTLFNLMNIRRQSYVIAIMLWECLSLAK